ncbi:STAS domain-containing protein [Conexibacter sp. CPCC 206217]|uniref:STAS domain-containing protein n=1 Tax=Conexibacter sp. CPCC 206217 TaxID=3064574 RepID=UPI0027280B28|nr:STAS domain-containing protein [Conexibacter sp. CPCC 206217]MDO8210862.1 STAS domain-containing protein [Conexibacter sp. CPCC 206217]
MSFAALVRLGCIRSERPVPGANDKRTTIVMVVEGGIEVVVARVDASGPDLALVDTLMRLRLEARRRGWRLELRDAPAQLFALLRLVGLADAMAFELRRQPELGEQLGEEEVVQRGDPPA